MKETLEYFLLQREVSPLHGKSRIVGAASAEIEKKQQRATVYKLIRTLILQDEERGSSERWSRFHCRPSILMTWPSKTPIDRAHAQGKHSAAAPMSLHSH